MSSPSLQDVLGSADLCLTRAPLDFHELDVEGTQAQSRKGVSESMAKQPKYRDPALVAVDLESQLKFLQKIKWQYQEYWARDQYTNSIVSDEPEIFVQQDIDELSLVNSEQKALVKAEKVRLAEQQSDVKQLAPLVEQDLVKLRTKAERINALSEQLIDARLRLTRLRQKHPQPRLTVARALVQLDSQTAEMQDLSDQTADIARQHDEGKTRLKVARKREEELRSERADVEKLAAASAGAVGKDDRRLLSLYEWFSNSLELHRSCMSAHTLNAVAENELRLTYLVPSRARRVPLSEISITLVFAISTRMLDSATVSGLPPDADMEELIEEFIGKDDVFGLVASVVAKAHLCC